MKNIEPRFLPDFNDLTIHDSNTSLFEFEIIYRIYDNTSIDTS